MNILILSVGTRNKLVQYFKEELIGKGRVIATDSSRLAPALYDADSFYIVPPYTDSNYLDTILQICKDNNVKGVFSLVDPELSILSNHIQDFFSIGTIPVVSDFKLVELCLNKFSFFRALTDKQYNTIRTYTDLEVLENDINNGNIRGPYFVKPQKGSASINIKKVDTIQNVKKLFLEYNDLIVQEFMSGQEIGIDVYIDLISREVVSIFMKKKIKMRAGETDKSVSFKDAKLFNYIKQFVEDFGFVGMVDIDLFEQNGDYYISEVNPRFGGGYLHAYECGVNFPMLLINNLNNIPNKRIPEKYEEDIYMLKYNDVKIISGTERK